MYVKLIENISHFFAYDIIQYKFRLLEINGGYGGSLYYVCLAVFISYLNGLLPVEEKMFFILDEAGSL
jgi:hypothetical protein